MAQLPLAVFACASAQTNSVPADKNNWLPEMGCAAEVAEPSSRSSLDEPCQLCLIPAMGKASEKYQSLPGREVLRHPQVLILCVLFHMPCKKK